MSLNNYGTGDESTLAKRRPSDLEFLDLKEICRRGNNKVIIYFLIS